VVYINELQGTDPNHLKVVATPKHFAVHSAPEATRSHFEAYTTDYDLFDTYLPAFQAAVERAHAQSIMGAYSGINGVPDNANHRLLGDILRKQWGFDGYVVSDCGAITNLFTQHHYAKSLAAAAADGVNAGCDLACDGAYVNLPEAVKEGLTTEKQIDVSLKRLFTERFKLGMFDPPTSDPYSNIPSSVIDSPEHRALAVKSAEESIVLLKNDNNTLPFGKSVHTIAVIGPNADAGDTLLGNYHGRPSSIATILQGITKRAGADVKVVYAQGCSIGVTSYTSKPIDPALLSFNGQAGLHGEYFLGNGFSGKPVLVRQDPTVQFEWSKTPPDTSIPHDNYCVRWTGMLTVPNTGTYRLEVTADDGSRLYINGKRVIDDWTTHPAQTRNAMVTLQGGQPTPIKLEYFQGTGQASVALNLAVPVAPDDSGYAEALAAAQNADAVVFVGGINGSFEGEGHDRTAIDLPDTQEQLLEKLGALGKPLTLVLVNGSMIAVNWAKDHATAIVEAWYPGEEGGTAVANVLFGDYNPAGRLPVTFYTGLNQVPDLEDYHMLHRTYRYFTDTPLFPFGYGLSYTTFSYGNLTCPPRVEANNGLTVSAQVANTGSVTGDEVVEAYLRPLPNKPDAHRMIDRTQPMPRLLLAGFQRVTNLAPGASQTVTVNIPASQLLLVNSKGQRRLQPGSWRVYIAGHQPDPTQTAEPGVLSSDVTVK
jgi:beta-glucosidase